MFWQLWVLIAAVAGGLLVVLAVKIRRAQQVFNRIIVRLDDPDYDAGRGETARGETGGAETRVDGARVQTVARHRRRHGHTRPTLIPYAARGHHRFRNL
jgi:hypothetical protein